MNKETRLHMIRETGVIAIMRAKSPDRLIAASEAICEGGIVAIEVTLTTPGALEVIKEVKNRMQENMLFGAGSILDSETARAAILFGADFIVCPTLNIEVISLCRRYNILVIPGCFTPTEMITAWTAGADMIKLFPADLGGPSLIKAILAPLPQLKIIPVGGVNLETAADFIRNGATAIAVGSNLINQELLEKNDMKEITYRARGFIDEVKKGRECV